MSRHICSVYLWTLIIASELSMFYRQILQGSHTYVACVFNDRYQDNNVASSDTAFPGFAPMFISSNWQNEIA